MNAHLRIARPVANLARSKDMYARGLGLRVLDAFTDHEGFDGVMLGAPGLGFHFEFTVCRAHPVRPAPTPEDLIVFYHPDSTEWETACAAMTAAGFRSVPSFNPYWDKLGRTFEDPDGYRTVIQREAWEGGSAG